MTPYSAYREKAGKARLAVLTAANCGPCRTLKPLLTAVCERHGIELAYFDAAGERDAGLRLGLRAVPAVVLCDDQGERVIFVGALTEARIIEKLTEAGVIAP